MKRTSLLLKTSLALSLLLNLNVWLGLIPMAHAFNCPQLPMDGVWQSLITDKRFLIEQHGCSSLTVTPQGPNAEPSYEVSLDGTTRSTMPNGFYEGLSERGFGVVDGGSFTGRIGPLNLATFEFTALLHPQEAALRRFVVTAQGQAEGRLLPATNSHLQHCVFQNCQTVTLTAEQTQNVKILNFRGRVTQTQISSSRAMTAILNALSEGRSVHLRRLDNLEYHDSLINIFQSSNQFLPYFRCNPTTIVWLGCSQTMRVIRSSGAPPGSGAH